MWLLAKQYWFGVLLLGWRNIFCVKVGWAIHDQGPKLLKNGSLKWLCEDIINHVGSQVVVHLHTFLLYLMGDVNLFDTEMADALAQGALPVDHKFIDSFIGLMQVSVCWRYILGL